MNAVFKTFKQSVSKSVSSESFGGMSLVPYFLEKATQPAATLQRECSEWPWNLPYQTIEFKLQLGLQYLFLCGIEEFGDDQVFHNEYLIALKQYKEACPAKQQKIEAQLLPAQEEDIYHSLVERFAPQPKTRNWVFENGQWYEEIEVEYEEEDDTRAIWVFDDDELVDWDAIDDSMSRDETDEDDYWYHAPIERQPEFIEDSSMSWDEADEDDAY